MEKMLSQNRPGTVVTPLNIAYWERNLNCNIDSLIGTHVTDKDVIVILAWEKTYKIRKHSNQVSSDWWNIASGKQTK